MKLRLQQPKHLEPLFRQLSRPLPKVWLRVYLVFGLLVGSLFLCAIWLRTASGESLPWYRWVAAGGSGLLFAAIAQVFTCLSDRLPRYAELRGDGCS